MLHFFHNFLESWQCPISVFSSFPFHFSVQRSLVYPNSPFLTVMLLTYPSGHNRAIVTASSSGVHAVNGIEIFLVSLLFFVLFFIFVDMEWNVTEEGSIWVILASFDMF
jgi:accessory gene regulator protein AgrB